MPDLHPEATDTLSELYIKYGQLLKEQILNNYSFNSGLSQSIVLFLYVNKTTVKDK